MSGMNSNYHKKNNHQHKQMAIILQVQQSKSTAFKDLTPTSWLAWLTKCRLLALKKAYFLLQVTVPQYSLENQSLMLIAKGHHLNSTTRKDFLEHVSTQHVIMFYFAEMTHCIKTHLSANNYINLHQKCHHKDLDEHEEVGRVLYKNVHADKNIIQQMQNFAFSTFHRVYC